MVTADSVSCKSLMDADLLHAGNFQYAVCSPFHRLHMHNTPHVDA
jgi:hypothetical protein